MRFILPNGLTGEASGALSPALPHGNVTYITFHQNIAMWKFCKDVLKLNATIRYFSTDCTSKKGHAFQHGPLAKEACPARYYPIPSG
ncbi:MAG: hypothetical protein ACRYF6_08175 [Janthinobacterium lividum]